MIFELLTEHPKILSVLLISSFVSIFSEGLGLGVIADESSNRGYSF